MAAKRSRDARRLKENQIALRAGFLEKEVGFLHTLLKFFCVLCDHLSNHKICLFYVVISTYHKKSYYWKF